MENITDKTGFKESEIVKYNRWNQRDHKWETIMFPKISGLLRLAHNENEKLSITTQIIRYDNDIAIVCANAVTSKGTFNGTGMASSDRDKEIAPAILELAETRAISRSLRFAGYGIEYCSAEEISHLNQNNEPSSPSNSGKKMDSRNKLETSKDKSGEGKILPIQSQQVVPEEERITEKQLSYLIRLGENYGMDTRELEKRIIARLGVRLGNLNKREATMMIDLLRGPME